MVRNEQRHRLVLSSDEFYLALMAPSGECLRGKGSPDWIVGITLAPSVFWQPIPYGLNLVVAAVLRDSLCVVSLLPCVADCCMLYTLCKVERFVNHY